MARWLVGTSGYVYRDWRTRFYPRALPARLWLPYFAARFDPLEVNSPFYPPPRAAPVRARAPPVPPGVVLALQARPVPPPRQRAERAGPAAHALPAPRARPRAGTRAGAHPAALDVPPASRPARRSAARRVAPSAHTLGARGAPCLLARRRGRRAADARQRRPVPA